MQSSKELSQEEYNETVYYCRSCHSLYIISGDEESEQEGWDGSYCGKCGSTDIGECAFGVWLAVEERLEQKRREREWNR